MVVWERDIVSYDLFREEECAEAFQMFNGRWYAQKQLSCTFCPVTKWKSAICGEFLSTASPLLLLLLLCEGSPKE